MVSAFSASVIRHAANRALCGRVGLDFRVYRAQRSLSLHLLSTRRFAFVTNVPLAAG
jgi:hypothetical protein